MGWAGRGKEGWGGAGRMAAASNVGGEWAYRRDAYYIKAVGISRSVCSLCDGEGGKRRVPTDSVCPRAAEDLAPDAVSYVGSGAAWQFGNPCSVLTLAHSADLYPVEKEREGGR